MLKKRKLQVEWHTLYSLHRSTRFLKMPDSVLGFRKWSHISSDSSKGGCVALLYSLGENQDFLRPSCSYRYVSDLRCAVRLRNDLLLGNSAHSKLEGYVFHVRSAQFGRASVSSDLNGSSKIWAAEINKANTRGRCGRCRSITEYRL